VATRSFDFSIDLEVHATREEVGPDAKMKFGFRERFDLNPEHTHSRYLAEIDELQKKVVTFGGA